ncbi:MAG: ABC transporter ATP-binding protein [Gammaproteobacteria bacterium]|nr:ABC transporter ATP-binding protein [Gammaproteobacteria bacterium]MDH5802861.1 ABC transporter ATP-binding protein [Gammaproteobacteria bacterium]
MTTAIAISDLRKTYKNGFEALKGIDLEVQAGDFFALLGPNGAGKSTTIGILCSLINKSSGTVQIFDKDIDRDFSVAKSYVGLVPQEFNFNVFEPIREVIINQAGYYGIPTREAAGRADKYLKKLGLWEKRQDGARLLSGGMKRRLMIARALVHQPKLLILDEPTAGVDIEIRHSMWEFIKEINANGTTIILTTHYLEEAESLCKNIAIIDHGCIIEKNSMQNLLYQLQMETYVLNLADGLASIPELAGYEVSRVDDCTLEVCVSKEQGINPLFELLSQKQIRVLSMRNKRNRLEELFMRLVGDNRSKGAG